MIAAQMHSDRARQDLTKKTGGQRQPRQTIRIKDKVAGKDSFPPTEDQQVDDFRARAAAEAFTRGLPHRNSTFSEASRKRSSVVAIVTKRVEMLHMNTICREFTQVLVCIIEGSGVKQGCYLLISADIGSRMQSQELLRVNQGRGRMYLENTQNFDVKRASLHRRPCFLSSLMPIELHRSARDAKSRTL